MSAAEPETLLPEEALWRRVHQTHLVSGADGQPLVSSAAFKDPELSVDRRAIVESLGHDHLYTRQDGAGVAEFAVADATTLGLQCVADELDDNPAHALVLGQKSGSVAKKLRDASTFIA